MTAQIQRLEAASYFGAATPTGGNKSPSASRSVRVAALPVCEVFDESIVTLVDAKRAYETNATLLEAAAESPETPAESADTGTQSPQP